MLQAQQSNEEAVSKADNEQHKRIKQTHSGSTCISKLLVITDADKLGPKEYLPQEQQHVYEKKE